MMKTNVLIAIMLLFMMTVGKTMAQPDPPNMEDMVKQQTEWMTKELSLTAKQLPVIDSLNRVAGLLRQNAFDDSQGDFEAIRPAMEKINAVMLPKYKAILTKQQFDLFNEKQKERMERGPGPE
jgi:hypothetical protein